MNPISQFISFATLHNGHKMPLAHERWTKQIEHLKSVGLVESGKIYSEDDLDDMWRNRLEKYSSDNGYAYWSWKPYLINQIFGKMQYGDSLCYFDGGCVFPEDKTQLCQLTKSIQQIIETVKKSEYDIALTRSGNIPCGYITRKEITDKLALSKDNEFLYRFPHWQAGLIIVVKTPRTEKLMKDWIQFFFDNYKSCIHFPFNEKSGQIEGFIHNGSDQAIFQCLLYKGQYKVLNLGNFLKQFIKRQRN